MVKWENVCLVCLHEGENRFIFEEDDDSKVIADKIMKCADILIKRDTNQPRNICLQCLDDLNVSYKFRRNCEQSDSIIKTLLSKNHQEFDIKDLWKTTPTTDNPMHDIHIKEEIVVYAVVDDTCENTTCLDDPNSETEPVIEDIVEDACNESTSWRLKDDPGTQSEIVVNDRGDPWLRSSAIELNNIKTNESKIKQKPTGGIAKQLKGWRRKSTASSRAKRKLKCGSKGRTQEICKICGQSFMFQIPFKIHMKLHGNERSFSCDHCDKAFVTAPELQCHVKVHTTQEPYKCQYCDSWFSDYSVKENHESSHTIEKPYKCPNCSKSFAYSRDLRIHISKNKLTKHLSHREARDELDKSSGHKQIHRPEKEIFQIEENAYLNEIHIKHEIIDNAVVADGGDNENRLPLEDDPLDKTVNKKITEQSTTEIPKRPKGRPKKSTLVSPKTCKICGRSFTLQTPFDIHMRYHNNERPFKCDHCDKAFVTVSELRRHVRVHGQKPYKCQYCDRRFSECSVKRCHERTHTGGSPYV